MKTAKQWAAMVNDCGCDECVMSDIDVVQRIRDEVVEELAKAIDAPEAYEPSWKDLRLVGPGAWIRTWWKAQQAETKGSDDGQAKD